MRQVQKSTPSIMKDTDTLLFIYLVFNVVFKHTGGEASYGCLSEIAATPCAANHRGGRKSRETGLRKEESVALGRSSEP